MAEAGALAAGRWRQRHRRRASAERTRRPAPTAAKQRPVLLADLATTDQDEPAHAAELLDQALDVLAGDWYATGHQRVGEVIAALPDGTDKTRIDERYCALTPRALPGP
jgi:hypothetical protein